MLAGRAVKDFYTIAGRRILIEAEDDWCAQAVSSWVARSFITSVEEDADRCADAAIRIRSGSAAPQPPIDLFQFALPQDAICHTDGETFYFDFHGSAVIFGPRKAAHVDVWITKRYEPGSDVLAQIISQAFGAALRRCDLYAFHSAGVVPPEYHSALLIAGPSGSGKSTLTLQLAASGWHYLSDDSVLLNANGQGVEAYPLTRFFGLTAHTISALKLSQLESLLAPPDFKARVSPHDLFPGQVMRARPGAILFSNVTKKTTTHIAKLGSSEAMTRLLRLSPWAGYDKPTASKHLSLLAELARDCIAFDLFAGTDLLEKSGLAAELLLANLAIA